MVSVIVPVYKVEKYLDRCLKSISVQSFKDLEIILVDDGSPDRCGILCDEWKKRDERIVVIHQKNGGLSAARNAGIDAARGEYLYFLDSDDYIEQDMILQLYTAMQRTGADIVCSNFVYEYENEEQSSVIYGTKSADKRKIVTEVTLPGAEFIRYMGKDMYAICVVAWNKLYSRHVFEQYRYREKKVHEDEFAMHHLVYPGNKVTYIPFVGYHYCMRDSSIMSKGATYPDFCEALTERIIFFVDQDEKELFLLNQGRWLFSVDQAKKKTGFILDKEVYTKVFLQVYQKKWITFSILLKRVLKYIVFGG